MKNEQFHNDLNMIIVDDSASIRLVTNTMLQGLTSGKVTSCSSGQEALNLIKSNPDQFDLIFTDLNMPSMDGMELIRHLGSHHVKSGIVIISDMNRRIIELASNIARQNKVLLIDSLSKPLTTKNLEKTIEKYLRFKHRQNQTHCSLTSKEISKAIKEKRLTPYYQPKINLGTQSLHSLELLARIDNPGDGHVIMPSSFISTAEKSGLIDQLTYQLLNTALQEYVELKQETGVEFSLAINLCPDQLQNLNTPIMIDRILEKHGVETKDITIEVTEENALETSNQLETLNRFRLKGYSVALDDFGTGFTNINQLLNLPFSEIKIDRTLITDIHMDKFSQIILTTLLDITENLDIDLVAEGIETPDELRYLNEIEQKLFIQGFLISKPKPKESIKRWINNWVKKSDQIPPNPRQKEQAAFKNI